MNSFSAELLAGRTVLVTGAGKGLGRACVQGLVASGARVIAVARTGADLEALADELGDGVEPWVGDVADPELHRRISELDRLDGLLNNAGTNRAGEMAGQSLDDFDAVVNLNVRALWAVTRAAIAPLQRAGRAAIVNMSSQMGHIGAARRTLYCLSKHAVEGLTKALAVELADQGVRVNSVAPTFVRTPLTEPMLEDPEFAAWVMGMIPMRKLATPGEVANACIYLLSDLSGSTTGSCLKVDGGWTAH